MFLALGLFSTTALACLHFHPKYHDTVKEGTKEHFLYSDASAIHWLHRTQIKSLSKEGLPPKLAYVLPLPARPKEMAEAPSEVFEELFTMTTSNRPIPRSLQKKMEQSSLDGIVGAPPSPVRAEPSVVVGGYKLTILEVVDNRKPELAARALNDWLKKNEMIEMPENVQRPYLKRGALFLAIEFSLSGSEASMKPLHLSFEKKLLPQVAGRPAFTLPMRLVHDTREFDMDVYLRGMHLLDEEQAPAPELFRKVADAIGSWASYPHTHPDYHPKLLALAGPKKRDLSLLSFKKLNSGASPLRDWKVDPSFADATFTNPGSIQPSTPSGLEDAIQ